MLNPNLLLLLMALMVSVVTGLALVVSRCTAPGQRLLILKAIILACLLGICIFAFILFIFYQFDNLISTR